MKAKKKRPRFHYNVEIIGWLDASKWKSLKLNTIFHFYRFMKLYVKTKKHFPMQSKKKISHLTKNEERKRKQITFNVRCTSIDSIALNDLHWTEKLNAAFRNRNCVRCHSNDQIYGISYSSHAWYNRTI